MQAVTLETAQGWCTQYEATLRASFRPEAMPEAWQKELAAEPGGTVISAIRRYALLKHFYRSRYEETRAAKAPDPAAAEAARQLLQREPVIVDLAGRDVQVTGRSYAAMYQIARHAVRLRALDAELEHIAESIEKALTRASRARLLRLQADIYTEMMLQRRAIYAHAFTPSGAPAASLEEAPTWWTEVGPLDDAALLAACWESGPARYARLGEPPKPKKRKGQSTEDSDAFGWTSLFASIERQQKIAPAELFNRDLWQLLAWSRAGAPTVPDELGG